MSHYDETLHIGGCILPGGHDGPCLFVTAPEPARSDEPRYRVYVLCECETCGGRGKAYTVDPPSILMRCWECRGEGRKLQRVAECDTPQDLGVAIVTLGREGQLSDCPIGVLDSQGEKGQKWLVSPWLPSPRNVSDAARTLAHSKARKP